MEGGRGGGGGRGGPCSGSVLDNLASACCFAGGGAAAVTSSGRSLQLVTVKPVNHKRPLTLHTSQFPSRSINQSID